ncbi:hypothetical protein GEMRC1_001034 [Eukaryota sp. GEM-RC1]
MRTHCINSLKGRNQQLSSEKCILQEELNEKNQSIRQLQVELDRVKQSNDRPRSFNSSVNSPVRLPTPQKVSSYKFNSNLLSAQVQEVYFKIKNGIEEVSVRIEDDNTAFAIADSLMSSPRLKKLDLSTSKKTTLNGLTALVDVLKLNSTVMSLSLGTASRENDAGYADIIGQLLSVNNTIQILELAIYLGNEGISTILDSLQNNSSVTSLNVSNTKIESFGFVALGDFLRTNRTLKNLNISNNCPCLGSFLSFVESLKTNRTLEHLNVSHIKLPLEGVLAFAESLKSNRTLKVLNVSNINLPLEGVLAFTESLKTNRTLEGLSISTIYLSLRDFRAFMESLKVNNILKALNLSNVCSSVEGFQAVSEFLKANKTLEVLNLHTEKGSDDKTLYNSLVSCLFKALETNVHIKQISVEIGYRYWSNNVITIPPMDPLVAARIVNVIKECKCFSIEDFTVENGIRTFVDALTVTDVRCLTLSENLRSFAITSVESAVEIARILSKLHSLLISTQLIITECSDQESLLAFVDTLNVAETRLRFSNPYQFRLFAIRSVESAIKIARNLPKLYPILGSSPLTITEYANHESLLAFVDALEVDKRYLKLSQKVRSFVITSKESAVEVASFLSKFHPFLQYNEHFFITECLDKESLLAFADALSNYLPDHHISSKTKTSEISGSLHHQMKFTFSQLTEFTFSELSQQQDLSIKKLYSFMGRRSNLKIIIESFASDDGKRARKVFR